LNSVTQDSKILTSNALKIIVVLAMFAGHASNWLIARGTALDIKDSALLKWGSYAFYPLYLVGLHVFVRSILGRVSHA